MSTFKTPKWDTSETSNTNYKNLFGKKQNKKQHVKFSNLNISVNQSKVLNQKNNINKKKIIKKKDKKLVVNPHFAKSKDEKNMKIINKKSPSKPSKIKVNREGVDLKKQKLLTKTNEYHTILKSRKEIMKMSLRERMLERLKSSRFRYINEELYTSEGKSAKDLFKRDPKAFIAYHEGYRQQVKKWPMNPLDVIIKTIKKMSTDKIIADVGCGDAKLSQSVQQKVHSFDLQAVNDYVTECEMSHVPLEKNAVDVVVFCLSLMGTNIKDFLFEANRILKIGGSLKIAEVQSRFEKVEVFIKGVEQFGFKQTWKDLSKDLFYFIDFKKINDCRAKGKLPTVSLLPCLYKKR